MRAYLKSYGLKKKIELEASQQKYSCVMNCENKLKI
jgi:protein tyrosine/serine phosphatase